MNEHIEADGPDVFHHACMMGLEGIVSKHRDSRYRSGRSPDWIKSKNPNPPAVKREARGALGAVTPMQRGEFANQQALRDYADAHDLEYVWEGMNAFAKRQRLLSREQYEIVEVRTSRGVSRVMLFSRAILRAEFEADAPMREALAIKRERLRAKRAAK